MQMHNARCVDGVDAGCSMIGFDCSSEACIGLNGRRIKTKMDGCVFQAARPASMLACAADRVCCRCSLVDSALGWSGIEDDDDDIPNGEKEEGGPADDDKPVRPAKPCAVARGNMVLLDSDAANDGGEVVKRGGGDDMV